MNASYGKKPNGNITASTFVKLDPSNTGFVLQCGSGDPVYGIAGPWTRRIALDSYDTPYIGIQGDPAIPIYGPGDPGVCLRLGAAVNDGDWLIPDTNGYGITSSTDHDKVGARALSNGNADDIIPVEVVLFERSK
jgi:hypothetical protein